ncbi:MAG TPA: HAMP domain-containing protein [Fibrobacteria bacterium]|nr:HAMP domain-containing protein [Fibrobacteria bacterium]
MLGIRRNSLSYKTAILYIVLTVLIASVFNFIIWENQSDLITRNQQLVSETQSVKLRQLVLRAAGAEGDKRRPEAYRKAAEAAEAQGVGEMTVFAENGELLFHRGPRAAPKPTEEDKVLLNRAIAKSELEDKEFYHDIRMAERVIHLYVPAPLPTGEQIVARFPLAIKSLEEEKNVLLRLCFLVTLIVIALQFIFALFLRRIVIVPISKLEKVTHEISKGDFNANIDIKQDDEIGMLANAFKEMTLNLVRIREEAKGSNPLSGLPGNNVIVQKIEEMIHAKREFAVIYGDLDNFKAYNDKYGFSRGDDAILYTRDCFLEAAKKFGDAHTFVGHEGGDDFVVVCSFETWEIICKGITTAFDADIKQFYNETDAKQGFIESLDRQGRRMRFPLMSISLAVASNHYRPIEDHRMVVSIAAEMKKYVKKMEGSSYAIDKRTN